MRPSVAHVSIRCIEPDSKYLLQFEEANVSEILTTVEAAIKRAGELVVEETRFTLYSNEGDALVAGTLFPNEFSGG